MDIVLVPVLRIVLTLLSIYSNIILIAVLLSWVRAFNLLNTSNRFVYTVCDVLDRLTEPVFQKARTLLPPFNGIDFSPIVVLLALEFLQTFLGRLLLRFLI